MGGQGGGRGVGVSKGCDWTGPTQTLASINIRIDPTSIPAVYGRTAAVPDSIVWNVKGLENIDKSRDSRD